MLTKRLFGVIGWSLVFLGLAIPSWAQEENQKRAEELFQKAINLKSRSISASEDILRQKEYFYKKAIELDSNYAEAHNNLGDVYENLGRYEEAIAEYKKANELRPDAEYPYFGLGDVYFKTGRYEEAIKWYEKGLKINPNDKLSQQKLKEAEDILNQGVIQAETIRGILARQTTRNVDGIRDSPGISFNKIYFEFDSATLTDQAIPQLKEIGEALSSSKLSEVSFKIAGHTDSRGSEEYNQRLSEQRAESVKRYLIKQFNISSQRLITVGYGEGRLIAFGNDETSHTINRRVEIERVEKEDESVVKPQKISVEVGFLYEGKDGKPRQIEKGMILTSKDNYKVHFNPHQDCWVYVYQKDSSGKVTSLFPNSKFTAQENPVKAKNDYWIPQPVKWFYLDETKGEETIYLVAVNEKTYDLEHIVSRYEKASTKKEKKNLADELVVQIKTRGLGGIKPATVSPVTSKTRPLDRETVERNGGFYTEITFNHR